MNCGSVTESELKEILKNLSEFAGDSIIYLDEVHRIGRRVPNEMGIDLFYPVLHPAQPLGSDRLQDGVKSVQIFVENGDAELAPIEELVERRNVLVSDDNRHASVS